MIFEKKFLYIIFMALLFIFSFYICYIIVINNNNLHYDREKYIEQSEIQIKKVQLSTNFEYYENSVLNDDTANLYINNFENKKNITVSVNAGHGTINGSRYFVYSHPDRSNVYRSGNNNFETNSSLAMSLGASYENGVTEADLNLKVAKYLRDLLLKNGYSVLMIREDDEVNLDNVARTIMSNEYADIEVSIHFDSGDTGKGFFAIVPLKNRLYRELPTVKQTYAESEKLANCIIDMTKKTKTKIFRKGIFYDDKIQFSYSKIPNVIVECGDGKTDFTNKNLSIIAEGIYYGIEKYFKEK